jgi:hypothetical protein
LVSLPVAFNGFHTQRGEHRPKLVDSQVRKRETALRRNLLLLAFSEIIEASTE